MTEGFEFVERKTVDVNDLEVYNDFRDPNKVRRVVLNTNEGKISFKPFRVVDNEREVQGFKIKGRRQELLTIEELPEQFRDLNEKLRKGFGLCKVRLSYFLWKKVVDDKIIPIRFMRNKQVDEMEFVDIEEKVK